MAAYTELTEDLLEELADDYGFGRITGASPIPQGSVNTNYLLETPKGKYLLRIDEAKGEMEVKREIDLLSFLHKHSFPCPHPLQDRKGRYYREYRGRCLSISKYAEGRMIAPQGLRSGQLEIVGRTLAELHVIGKGYKKGIDNRFSFERVADLYNNVRNRLPPYFRRITRTLDDEIDYLNRYLEDQAAQGYHPWRPVSR